MSMKLKYEVELEINDTVLSLDGLRHFLEVYLAEELSREQLGKKVTVKVKKTEAAK